MIAGSTCGWTITRTRSESSAGILDLSRLFMDRPDPADLVALDETLAAEYRALLTRLGWDPGRGGGPIYAPMWPDEAEPDEDRPMAGEPRPLPSGWDDPWQASLLGWMAVENLGGERAAAG